MATIKIREHGNFPPERFVAALTDFGPGRSKLWGNSQSGFLEVHDQGEGWAEVTEGSGVAGGIWQRYRYDWSKPGVVRLEVLDSNAFGRGSSWEYRLTPDPGGGSRIDLTIRRRPTTFKGRLVDLLLRLGGKLFFVRDLRRTIRKLEQPEVSDGRSQ
jgi:hypothetical protein